MSGYLQRLATSALQPASAIHPALGSMFHPQDAGQDHQFSPYEDETIFSTNDVPSPLVSPVDVQPTSRSPRSESRAAVETNSSSSSETVQPMASSGERDSFHPLLPSLMADVSTARTGPARDTSQEDRPKASSVPAYVPLVDAKPDLPEERPTERQPIASRSSTPQREAPAATNHSNSEPDEIQIHIGRIEVTAVPQSLPRASKPARKGMSLEEYLKGRDRSA